MKTYVDWWRKRASLDANGWKALVEERQQAMAERLKEYFRSMVNPGPMLEGLGTPPLEWGIGRWQVSNRLLATALPGTNEWFWGDWLAGRYERGNIARRSSRPVPRRRATWASMGSCRWTCPSRATATGWRC